MKIFEQEYAILSAIWILASNDERSLITYQGLEERLNSGSVAELRSLVERHRELFRLEMPKSQLEAWKEQMRAGRQLPGWLRKQAPEAQLTAIEALKETDGFRSQFRAQAGSEKSPIAIIEWGLAHIERLRKAKSEAEDARVKQIQMWLVFLAAIAGSFLGSFATIHAAMLKHI